MTTDVVEPVGRKANWSLKMSGYKGVNPGVVGDRDPKNLGGGTLGSIRGRDRVLENTIAYFGQKVCWKVIFFKKKEKAHNVGVNGKRQFLS